MREDPLENVSTLQAFMSSSAFNCLTMTIEITLVRELEAVVVPRATFTHVESKSTDEMKIASEPKAKGPSEDSSIPAGKTEETEHDTENIDQSIKTRPESHAESPPKNDYIKINDDYNMEWQPETENHENGLEASDDTIINKQPASPEATAADADATESVHDDENEKKSVDSQPESDQQNNDADNERMFISTRQAAVLHSQEEEEKQDKETASQPEKADNESEGTIEWTPTVSTRSALLEATTPTEENTEKQKLDESPSSSDTSKQIVHRGKQKAAVSARTALFSTNLQDDNEETESIKEQVKTPTASISARSALRAAALESTRADDNEDEETASLPVDDVEQKEEGAEDQEMEESEEREVPSESSESSQPRIGRKRREHEAFTA